MFQCRTGEILQEGQPSSTTGRATSCGNLSKFLQKKKKKPEIHIWEGVWSNLDLMDSVCVCVYAQHPLSGMCQGSTGRMASSFSSLFRRNPRRCRVTRLLAPSLLLTSETPISLLMSSRSARVSPCTSSRKKDEPEKMDVMLLIWGTNGNCVVQRLQYGKVRTKLGLKTKACLQVTQKTMCATKRCTTLGCTAW